MDDKRIKESLPSEDEQVLAFEEAKELTIAEAVKKHQEIQVGITEEDGVLDRYIKQHREDIESKKFETATLSEDEMVEASQSTIVDSVTLSTEVSVDADVPSPLVVDSNSKEIPQEQPSQESEVLISAVSRTGEAEAAEQRKKILTWVGVGVALVGLLGTAFLWLNQQGGTTAQPESSTSSTTSSPPSSSSAVDTQAQAFKQLYAQFFTDQGESKLKNASFEKLPELKTLLDKMDKNSEAYKSANQQYSSLSKAIEAIQQLNGQFDKPLIVDGEIDTTAVVKPEAKLAVVTTGLTSVDSLLTSAVNFGRSQQETASSSSQASSAAPAEEAPAQPASSESQQATPEPQSEVVTQGVGLSQNSYLQRHLSRVPYNQSQLADTGNDAWNFGPGILENILSISRQRGYITGDQYVLERVAIINGNGYYNLFRPDGTYLFSINCKTGYFVGNGAGHSDALDY